MQGKDFLVMNQAAVTTFMAEHGATCRVRPPSEYRITPGENDYYPSATYYHSPAFTDQGALTRWVATQSQITNRLMTYMRLRQDLHLNFEAANFNEKLLDATPRESAQGSVPDDTLLANNWRRFELIRQVGDLLQRNGFARRLSADAIALYVHSAPNSNGEALPRDLTERILLNAALVASRKDLTIAQRKECALHDDVPALLAAVDDGLAYEFATLLYRWRY